MLLNASGCLDALTAPGTARQLDASVTEDRHARAPRGQPASSDRGDRRRHSELDGLANPGRRRSSPRRCRGWRSSGCRSGSRSAVLRPRSTPTRAVPSTGERRRCVELNLSCPNVDEAPESAAEIVASCRRETGLPLYAKLSPAVPDVGALARAVEYAGADGLSLVNTIRGSRSTRGCGRCSDPRRAGTRGLRSSRSPSRPYMPLSAPPSYPSWAWGASLRAAMPWS